MEDNVKDETRDEEEQWKTKEKGSGKEEEESQEVKVGDRLQENERRWTEWRLGGQCKRMRRRRNT